MLLLAKIASPFSLNMTCLTLKSKSKQRTAGYTHAHYSYGKYRIRAQVNDLMFLGIETSCDDTGAAVVTGDGEILSQVISSQADLLAQYGGVVPKMAEEAHAQVIDRVVEQAIQDAKLKPSDLTAVAVTIGPGLSLCLRIGVRKARTIAGKYSLPMVGVHHMEAHALVARLTEKELDFPFLTLLVSGGHNLLILAQNVGQYIQLGTTIDDAIGEAYDKIAKWLGLDMRKGGGPALEELAKEGDQHSITLSVPMQKYKDCNFSYAGLKTQVRRIIEFNKIDAIRVPIISASSEDRKLRANIAASFQRVAVLHLEQKCERAVEWAQKMEPFIKSLVLSGGVASNHYVRMQLDKIAKKHNLNLVCPPPNLCTDNGVMVAWTGIEYFRLGRCEPPLENDEPEDGRLDLRPRWQLGEIYEAVHKESDCVLLGQMMMGSMNQIKISCNGLAKNFHQKGPNSKESIHFCALEYKLSKNESMPLSGNNEFVANQIDCGSKDTSFKQNMI